ncbi:MAG: hypothetical protein JNK58_10330 [Phycisphaerae bacterium]|nr:hypothetical protein [Phycisphaerae bacterium]
MTDKYVMRWIAAAVGAFTVLGLGWWSSAQPARPSAAQRIVKTWDFDDPLSRVEPVPIGWFRAQDNPPERERPGFPAWNVPGLSGESPRSGPRCVVLPTKGGNTALRLSAGAVPVLPDADYMVSAMVRTDGLGHAKACVSAWLLDEDLQPVGRAPSRSELLNTGGEWSELVVRTRGESRAAWLQIELLLLQPREFEAARSVHQVWPEDFSGAAYFDDLVVSQVPRVELIPSSPAGVFIGDEKPELLMMVRDLTGEPLSMELTVFDLDGKIVERERMPVPEGGRVTPWRPRLDRFGWYSTRMEVSSSGTVVGRRRVDLVWSPDGRVPDGGARRSFGVIAEGVSAEQRAGLGDLLPRILSGAVNLSVFTPDRIDDAPGQGLEELWGDAERLLSQGVDITFVLTNLPRRLTHELRIDPDNPIPMLLAANDPWVPYLSKTLNVFGERVRRWQLGPTGSESAIGRPALKSDLDAIRRKLRTQIPRPVLVLPWNLSYSSDEAGVSADSIMLTWPIGVPADAIAGGYRAASEEFEGLDRTLHIELPDQAVFGGRAAAIELARRATTAWAAGVRRMSIDHSWRVFPEADERLQPTPEAAVWRTMCSVLSESTVVGMLPVADGVSVYLVEGAGGGALIGWNDGADPEDAVIRGWLGEGRVSAVDPFGNRRDVPRDSFGSHGVQLEEMPTIVTGVDVPLARFRAAVRVDPPFLAARAERHEVEVVIENPWPVGITGRLRLAEPVEWTISPRVIPFVLSPGETARVRVEIAFAPGQEAGRQRLIAEVDLSAERRYPVMRWPLALDLGLPTVEMSPSYRVEPSPSGEGSDLVVSMLITNSGDSPLTVEAFAQAPGYRAFEAPVSGLAAGGSVTRRFRFEGGGEQLKGRSVRVGLKETSGTGRLNRTLHIE